MKSRSIEKAKVEQRTKSRDTHIEAQRHSAWGGRGRDQALNMWFSRKDSPLILKEKAKYFPRIHAGELGITNLQGGT